MRFVSWIGGNDLKALQDQAQGPVCSTVQAFEFSELHLLYNYPKKQVQPYLSWLQEKFINKISSQAVALRSPVDFHDIYLAADTLLSKLTAKSEESIAILLSPGTPAMQAVWILLGKTKYKVEFYQSSVEQGVEPVQIPFEIAAEYLPQKKLPEPKRFSQLAAGDVPVNAAFDDIITQNPHMLTVKSRATVLAKHDVPVLIYGESGTGKEIFATAIHNASQRANKSFIAVNCGAIPPDLIDSVFFGHMKGAFTGANTNKDGFFQQADGGTLFLDEFGELEPAVQVRLLRVLQSGELTPVGASQSISVDVRIIAATNRDLIQDVAAGRFREDLFYRIAVGVLHLPPLRQRQGDILLLSEYLLTVICEELKLPKDKKFSAEAKNLILKQSWCGNIRELQATLLRAALWSTDKLISAIDIQQALFAMPESSEGVLGRDISQGVDIQELIDDIVQHYVPRALSEAQGNKTKAAEFLGLSNYQTLSNWIKKHNVK